jgi:putative transposase
VGVTSTVLDEWADRRVTQVGEHIWIVTFMRYDVGYFDEEMCRIQPTENPFDPKLLPMSPE